MRFIVFLLLTIGGILILKYSKFIVDSGLRSAWADEHLPLGSYSGVKILGLVIIVFAIMYLFKVI